jgi:hypothetical protein
MCYRFRSEGLREIILHLLLQNYSADRPTENPLFTFKKMSVFLLKGLSHKIDLDLKTCMVSSRPK